MELGGDHTPRSRSSGPVRLAGIIVVAALVIAVILLALGILDFEARNWFG